MTEITRVPLPPIARGSVGKLWIGVAAGSSRSCTAIVAGHTADETESLNHRPHGEA